MLCASLLALVWSMRCCGLLVKVALRGQYPGRTEVQPPRGTDAPLCPLTFDSALGPGL
jgi:hypothetical protein